MRIYTVHARAGQEPVLVREGFSLGALLLPTLWFLWNRMWLVALLHFLGVVAIGLLLPDAVSGWVALAFQLLVALHARDLRRWTLRRRGFALVGVVAAANEEAGFGRVAMERPDLFRGPAIAGLPA